MAERIQEIIDWLQRVQTRGGQFVWVDEGGLTLETDNDARYELGGEPEDDYCLPPFGDDGNGDH